MLHLEGTAIRKSGKPSAAVAATCVMSKPAKGGRLAVFSGGVQVGVAQAWPA